MIRELYEETGKAATFLELDLASLHSVKASAEDFLRYVRTCRTSVNDLFTSLDNFLQQGNGASHPVQ